MARKHGPIETQVLGLSGTVAVGSMVALQPSAPGAGVGGVGAGVGAGVGGGVGNGTDASVNRASKPGCGAL